MKLNFRSRKPRKGFTLIELIVVLFILIGLAALIIPTVTDLVGRTKAATAASSINDVANAIQRYEVQYLTTPDHYDSLVTSLTTGADLNTLDSNLSANLVNVTLDASTLATLNAAGILSVGVHATDDGSYARATPTALAATKIINGLSAGAQVTLGLETSGTAGKYVLLGVGSITDMKGRTMMEPPVAFPGEGPVNPNTAYRRFLAVYQITDGTNALAKAKLVAVISPDGKGLAAELGDYFTLVTGG